eukprot:GILK01005597.1.p1 GENE.GILK01005597.1~~GILK01005597.1.p1  ORF type:complete len:145 (+),score=27.61 GILK01005597.1:46-435(+)
MSLPPDVEKNLSSFEDTISKLETHLKPLFETDINDLSAKLSPLESAKLNVMLAYGMDTLFYLYLKTQGVSPLEHPIKGELDRVKSYMKKVKEASDAMDPQNPSTTKGPTIKVNSEAAKRVVKHSLAGQI